MARRRTVNVPSPTGLDYVSIKARQVAKEIYDLSEENFALREALYDLLHLHAMGEMGQAHHDQPDRWRKAWSRAAEVYGEEQGR